MIRRHLAAAALAALALAGTAAAQEEGGALDFAGDAFRAGGVVVLAEPNARDAFLTGERVELAAPIAGSAHLAGRRVETTGDVGGALYAAGADVRVGAPVAGAASLAGYDVTVAGAIGGNLRAAGQHVEIAAPVAGGALLAADRLRIEAPIAGDVRIVADELAFGEGARIDGRLTLFEEEDQTLVVPASVAPSDRIDRRKLDRGGRMAAAMPVGGWAAIAAAFVIGVVVLALLVTLTAALAPRRMARLRGIVAAGPFRAMSAGFLAISALIGAAVVLVATLFGVVIAPFALLAAGLLGFLGYLVAVYLVGVWAIMRAGALDPDGLGEYALAAFVGALIVGLLSLLPFLGWFVLLALTFVGAGAIAIAAWRPRARAV
jgi:cytoskeletal protein CcmA (bactofilin family)